jgi:DNA repair protein RadA/Sms
MLLAVLTKRAGLALSTQDVFVNVVGGFELTEPAVDLGIALAIASNFVERRVAADMVALGEVGLGGELRAVPRLAQRVREAAKLGFRRVVAPPMRLRAESDPTNSTSGLEVEIIEAATLSAAVEIALE